MEIIFIIIIILLVIICLICIKHQLGPNQHSHLQGYTQKGDTLEVTLSRIEQTALRPHKINYNGRYLLWALWIVLFISIILLDRLPTPALFLQALFTTWVGLISLESFFYFHSDKMSQYITLQGIKRLRKKLNLRKVAHKNLSKPKRPFYCYESPHTFAKTDILNYIPNHID